MLICREIYDPLINFSHDEVIYSSELGWFIRSSVILFVVRQFAGPPVPESISLFIIPSREWSDKRRHIPQLDSGQGKRSEGVKDWG